MPVAGQAKGAEAAILGAQTRVPTADEAKTYRSEKFVRLIVRWPHAYGFKSRINSSRILAVVSPGAPSR